MPYSVIKILFWPISMYIRTNNIKVIFCLPMEFYVHFTYNFTYTFYIHENGTYSKMIFTKTIWRQTIHIKTKTFLILSSFKKPIFLLTPGFSTIICTRVTNLNGALTSRFASTTKIIIRLPFVFEKACKPCFLWKRGLIFKSVLLNKLILVFVYFSPINLLYTTYISSFGPFILLF